MAIPLLNLAKIYGPNKFDEGYFIKAATITAVAVRCSTGLAGHSVRDNPRLIGYGVSGRRYPTPCMGNELNTL